MNDSNHAIPIDNICSNNEGAVALPVRPNNRSEDVRNLYFVGAGTHPGAGVPGVIASAKVVESLVPDASTLV